MSRTARVGLVALMGLLSCGGSGDAAPGGCTDAPYLTPFAFETITVSSTALGFTATTYAPSGQWPADMAVITTETDSVRYRADGLNPTATVGHLLASSGTLTACGYQSIRNARFIRVTADASMSVSYYRMYN